MRLTALLLSCSVCVLAGAAFAGSFGVAPTRLDFDRGTRSTVIEIASEDAQKLSFQAKLFEWKQGPDGKDEYVPSQDLIWFPQLFTVDPKGKRIIRVGTRPGSPPDREKTYRLFIEEIAPPAAASSGAEVRVVLRFGVPIFIAPAVAQKSFAVESVESARGKVLMRVRNNGTQSARFETVTLQRGDTVLAEAQGWYLLVGGARTFEIPVDPAKCPPPGPVEAVASAEGVVLRQAFSASPVLCERP